MRKGWKQTPFLPVFIVQSKQLSWTTTCSRLNHSPAARLSINSCSQAGVEIPQHTSSYEVYGNVTSQLGLSKGTDSDAMDGANRRTQGLKNL